MLLRNNIISLLCLIGFMNYGYCQDLIPYRVDDKWGYADKAGKIVCKAVYDSVGVFEWNNTLKKHGSMVYKKDKSIYIDKKISPIFNAAYKDIILDYYGWIIARESTGKLKLYDASIKEFGDFTFDTFQTESSFIIVENKSKIGLINSKSEIIIPIEYDQIYYNIFHDGYIKSEEYEQYQLKDFNIERKNYRYYLDGTVLPEDRDIVLATVVNNKETKRILKFVHDNDRKKSDNDHEETISSLRYYSREDDERLKAFSEKKGLNFTECDSKYTACIFKKDNQYGIYNLKTNTSSELFDKVELVRLYGVFKVTKDRIHGLYNNVFEALMPVKYSYFNIDYDSNFIVTASYDGASVLDPVYDYYNIKAKKYIITDCDFLYGNYVDKSSKNGVYFFPVKKNESIFYVNENGIKYIR